MAFKPIHRFHKIKFSPASGDEDKNHYEFSYDLIKGHNKNGEEIKESLSLRSPDEPIETFKKVLRGLDVFVCEYCELPEKYVDRISVRGVSLTWKDNEDDKKVWGAVITGVMSYKRSNGVLVLNTPFRMSGKLKAGGDESNLLSSGCITVIQTLFKESERFLKGERSKIEIDFADEPIEKGKGVSTDGKIIEMDGEKK